MRVSDEVKILGAVVILTTLLMLHSYGITAIEAHIKANHVEATE